MTVGVDDVALLGRLTSEDTPSEVVVLALKLIELRCDSERLYRANSDLEYRNALLRERLEDEARRLHV